MKKWLVCLGLCAAALLSACGGGGGSSGDTQEQYSITLRADKTSLPLNIGGVPPGAGVNAPYTTTLYVNAREGNDPIQDGDNIFSCNMTGGLDVGALYYLDGDSSHQDSTTDAPLPYRNITLGANAGGNSFHFHASSQAGTAHITCTVTDPRDNRVYSASVDITVGTTTGKAGSIQVIPQQQGSLGVQGNLANLRTSVDLQAYVWDDANQPVPNPSAPNLQVSILSYDASPGARLLAGARSGTSIQVNTLGGVGSVALSSGWNTGLILLQFTADRADNDVSNGLQDPVTHLYPVVVTDGSSATSPLVFDPVPITTTNGALFGQALSATGGVAPYTWTALDPLPTGLSLSADGVISGVPNATPGDHLVRVRVADAMSPSNTVTSIVTITVKPATSSLVIGNSSVSAMVDVPFSYALSANGGVAPLTWTALGPLPLGLNINSNGLITGTPTVAGNYTVAMQVTDSTGASAIGNVSMTIQTSSGLVITSTSISTVVSLPMSYALSASGGVAPLKWAALGPLPAGLNISSDGLISGTPTQIGTYLVVIQVTDSKGAVVTGNLSIAIRVPS